MGPCRGDREMVVARRVPDDEVAVIANCYTIQAINLLDDELPGIRRHHRVCRLTGLVIVPGTGSSTLRRRIRIPITDHIQATREGCGVDFFPGG
jgi:hypothetical protein